MTRTETSTDLKDEPVSSTEETSKVTNMENMFANTMNLQSLKLGKGFRFAASNTDLPEPPNNDKIAGKWRNLGSGDQKKPLGKNLWTSSELMMKYNGETDADTYVWQPTGISIDLVSENFSFPKVQISGKKQTVTPTEKASLSLTDALPKNDTGTQLLVSYDTPNDEWQKAGFSLKVKPSTTQPYIQTAEVQVSPDATPIITQFDESKKQGGTIVDLNLSPELTVPQSLTAKNYSTTIVWTIQQGPK